jgi:NAD(P)-dependent dehydrogenase (short-subunit alcohol dehydrogenase family)
MSTQSPSATGSAGLLAGRLLSGKVVLISGGTQGVGAAAARAALREGAEAVVVTGRRADVGAEMVASCDELADGRLSFEQTDVATTDGALAGVAATVQRHGRVDCVVNAAGLTTRGRLVDTTPELFDAHIAVNLRAPFFVMQAAVRDMLARKAPGTIVNVITSSAHCGQPFLAPYSTAKAGLVGLTRNAAHAHRFDRIRINGVNIGWTDTEGESVIQARFHDAAPGWQQEAGARLPMGRLGDVDEIADLIVFLLSDRSGVVTGSVMDWDQNVLGALD